MVRVIVVDSITEDVISKATSEVKDTTNVIYLSTVERTLKITGHVNGYGSEYITERQMRREVDFETIEIEKW